MFYILIILACGFLFGLGLDKYRACIAVPAGLGIVLTFINYLFYSTT